VRVRVRVRVCVGGWCSSCWGSVAYVCRHEGLALSSDHADRRFEGLRRRVFEHKTETAAAQGGAGKQGITFRRVSSSSRAHLGHCPSPTTAPGPTKRCIWLGCEGPLLEPLEPLGGPETEQAHRIETLCRCSSGCSPEPCHRQVVRARCCAAGRASVVVARHACSALLCLAQEDMSSRHPPCMHRQVLVAAAATQAAHRCCSAQLCTANLVCALHVRLAGNTPAHALRAAWHE
jgi:hypothetical protein